MTNENNNEENIHWEESTKHRDAHSKKEKDSPTAKKLIKAVNLAIKAYNGTAGKAAGFFKKDWKLEEMDEDKTMTEIMEGGGAVALGLLDDGIKAVRRIVIPAIQSGGIFTGWLGTALSGSIATAEFAIDHLKDFMTSMAFSGLSAEIGDLKDGQARLNSKVDAQGKLMNKRMGDLKTELEGQLKQQGAKFDKEIKDLDQKIAQAQGENKKEFEKLRKEAQQQKQELESQINQVTQNLNRVESQLTNALNDFKNEVNERFDQQEKKILDNKRKIEEEKRQREAETKEIKDKVKLTNTKLENLQQEKNELQEDFQKHQFQTNQKLAETQQELENTREEFHSEINLQKTKLEQEIQDAQEELEFQTTNLNAKISVTQEILQEQTEEIEQIRYEQKKSALQQQELVEELQETNDILHAQQRKLTLVSQQMEDIQEEVHERMDKVQKDHQKLTKLAQDTSQKVEQLTEEVKNIRQTTEELAKQIKQNKEETEQVKKQAKLTNERLDNLLKIQALNDYSSELSNFDKIQKSLELKAEETKLLATLNLLKETKKLITPQPTERNWKVGVETGTAPHDFQTPEGFALTPNSWWEKRYTGNQVKADNPHSFFTQAWFNWEEKNKLAPEKTKLEWGERLKTEHESAPLTDKDKRQEQQTNPNTEASQAAGEENQQAEQTFEKIEEIKAEVLERLQAIQAQQNQNLNEVEQAPIQPSSSSMNSAKAQTSQKRTEQIQVAQQKVTQLKADYQVKKNNIQIAQQKLTEQTPKENWETEPEIKNWIKQNQAEQRQIQQELNQVQSELTAQERNQEIEESLEKFEENLQEDKQEELIEQWQQIQALSQQVLEDQPKPEKPKEEDLKKKLEELVQQIKETEQSAAASKKTMSMWMLFLIIFLLEYVVYKKNGLPGLIILNVILAILYYKKDVVLKYYDLWQNYFLIIGYVIGNVLAYSAIENPKYKWPSVIGFNLIILGIYSYTYWKNYQEQAKLATSFQEKTTQICQEKNIQDQEWKTIENNSFLDNYVDLDTPFNPNFTEIKTQQVNNLQRVIQEQEITKQKETQIQQQTEILQKSAEIQTNLEKAQAELGNLETKITWTKIKQNYPEFARRSILLRELASTDRILESITTKQIDQDFLNKLARLSPASSEENNLLSQLHLTPEQFIAISQQAYHFTPEEKDWLEDNYVTLSAEQKLTLVNTGLDNLGIDDLNKKQIFVRLNHQLHQEQSNFGLTIKEKENILRLLVNTINLTKEQQEHLEKMGVSFFNASNWHIDNTQKNHLLSFGLSKLNLSHEQQENLLNLASERFKTFSLTDEQKNILQSLVPLTHEDKYSENSLDLLKLLGLKQKHLSFFTNEEIIPHPNLDFGEISNPYLSLKLKYLTGEQKLLEITEREKQKQLSQQKVYENKLSILKVLLEFAENNEELHQFTYSLEEWVKIEVLKDWQGDILLLLGLKTIPQYNFFELLSLAVEKILNQPFDEFLQKNQELVEDYQEYLKMPKQKPIIIKNIWEKQRALTNNFDLDQLEELVNNQIKIALGNYQPIAEAVNNSNKKEEATESVPIHSAISSRYDDLLTNLSAEETRRQHKKQEREEAKKKLEEVELARRQANLSEKDRKLQEAEEKRQQEKELEEQEAEKKRQAEEQRARILQEEQTAFLQNKEQNIEAKRKAAEQALINQQKANELAEKSRQAEIERLAKENQAEQERLSKQMQLIEEEAKERLNAVSLEDKEERQLIEKRANEKTVRLQAEMNRKKRENEEELVEKEREMQKANEEKRIELEKLEKDYQITKIASEKELADLKKEKELNEKITAEETKINKEKGKIQAETHERDMKLEKFREKVESLIFNAVISKYSGGEKSLQYSGRIELKHEGKYDGWNYVKDVYKEHLGIKINFWLLDKNWYYSDDESKQIYKGFVERIAGNSFYTEEETKEKIAGIRDLEFYK